MDKAWIVHEKRTPKNGRHHLKTIFSIPSCSAVIITLLALSCRSVDKEKDFPVIENYSVMADAMGRDSAQTTSPIKDPPKDPPKDVPKDYDNWRPGHKP